MQKIAVLGGRMFGLTALLGRIFAGPQAGSAARSTRPRTWKPTHRRVSSPTWPRYWHDLAHPGREVSPEQRATLKAAADKRARRAEKRKADAQYSFANNAAHRDGFHWDTPEKGFVTPFRLNPFYIAK